ncbi:MAG: adenylate/guanylate cyclase domain-containing protein, partial [Myxococcales bacterium]|nr:adenylate/guanylate cyclase domain-containing protein [Myxococcales bacterium]
KTIGDAIMASFADPADAVAASIAMQRRFGADHAESKLRIRITLHTGPCLAVNLNTGVDYFGTTVNLAAKIQSAADAGQVAFTEQTWNDPGVRALLAEKGLAPTELDFEFRQAEQSIKLYRIDVE